MAQIKVKVVQLALLLSVIAFLPARAHTAILKCDAGECAALCADNQANCAGQGGTITEDCTGQCVGNDCADHLTCKLPF